MDNKKNIFGRITNRMKRGSSRCSSGFFPIQYPAERGRERGGSTTDFQAPNDALDIYTHTHIFRVECARSKREKPRSFKKKIEKVCYDHVFIQCSTSYLSLPLFCVYVPLSIPPCKHFKRQIITRTYIVDKQRCIFSTHQRHSQFFFNHRHFHPLCIHSSD